MVAGRGRFQATAVGAEAYATRLAADARRFKLTHSELVSATNRIPGFVLALAPNSRRYVPGFMRRVLRFSLPIGVVTGLCAYLGYLATRLLDTGAGVPEGRTTATIVVLIVSRWTVVVIARPLTGWKVALVAVLAASAALVVAVPAIGEGLFLMSITPLDVGVAAVVGAGGALSVEVTHRAVAAARQLTAENREVNSRAVRVPHEQSAGPLGPR